ncbi:MAG: ABC transporter ATP-binding protein [Bacteroidetes bacterium]|nr:ABC transporter ATP-binding protein [Bacteroidota bacterium]
MVELSNIRKSFGKLPVLNGVSMNIAGGKIVTREIFVNGQNIKDNPVYRHLIGYLPQTTRFPENLSVREFLRMIEDVRMAKGKSGELLSLFALDRFLNKSLRNLSGGTRQKVNVVLSLMFYPSVYIMDEPTVGLDPVSRVRFKELLKKEKENGKTLLLVTHLLSEAEELADEIVFLMDGYICYHGDPKVLMAEQKENTLEKAIAGMMEVSTQNSNPNINSR